MIYEATVTYIKVDDNGNDKQVKETFVLENMETFAEVEKFLYEEFGSFTAIDVVAIKRSTVKEIANERQSQDDKIWEATVQDVFTNDQGEEKELKYKVLLFSNTIENAIAFVTEYMEQGYSMTLVSLKRTKFMDLY